ncbi:MAG TPA: ATP-grasp domain-containing protein [Polyangiaceae bacterium]|nr:ATP-grasp domain-containing protein [Polyangiaceae bacterium]
MDDAQAAKRFPRKKQQAIDVAIIYNVDFEEARTEADPCFESRATVESVAEDVATALESDGKHNVTLLPTEGDFAELRARLETNTPMCVFNLCESLGSDARLETAIPTVLDLMGIPYTGSAPDALSAALYKDRVKQRLIQAGVPTPQGMLFEREDAPCDLPYPLIVKPAWEDGSAGIWGKSVVHDEASLRELVAEVINLFKAPALVEQYIEGREFNVALLGFPQARVLPLQEIDFSNLPSGQPHIVSYDAKWRTGSVEDLGTQPVMHPELQSPLAAKLRRAATEACRAVGVRDYGRVDVRLSNAGVPYVIDVNPNCDLSPDAGYARAAQSVGIDYPALMRLLVRYALSRKKGVGSARQTRTATSVEAR